MALASNNAQSDSNLRFMDIIRPGKKKQITAKHLHPRHASVNDVI